MSKIVRTRTRGSFHLLTPTTTTVNIKNWDGSSSTGSETLSIPGIWEVGEIESMTDNIIPNFHARSARGEVFVNGLIKRQEEREITLSNRAYTIHNPSTGKTYSANTTNSFGSLNSMNVPLIHLSTYASGTDSATRRASTQARANVDSPTFAGAVFVGELRETIGFLRNPIRSWLNFLESLRKPARRARARNVRVFLEENWLTYRFAVRPILSDIKSAAVAISEVIEHHAPERKTARGFGESDGYATTSKDNVFPNTGGMVFTNKVKTDNRFTVRAGVLYELQRSADTFGVSARQLPVAAWELIPFSFVVDYFTNVGQFIEAITPVAGVKILGEWVTTKSVIETTRETRWTYGGTTGGLARTITADGLTVEILKSTITERSPRLGIGLVTPNFDLSRLGTARILDLVALSSVALYRRP